MKSDKVFPHLARLCEFGDKISKGNKTGANISIGEGGVVLANDMHSIVLLLEHAEFNEEIAFKSHLFPEAISPLGIDQHDKSVDFSWMQKGIKKTVNIPSCTNLFEKGKEAIEKMWVMDGNTKLPVKCFDTIDDGIHILKIKRGKDDVIFEQMTTTGDEIFKNEIPLKSSGGLLAHNSSEEAKEVETIVPTIEFKYLPLLTDESIIDIFIPEDNSAVFAKISMGSLTAKVIVTPMKYKR
jgi:hypothetical protein